jgi:hypothetical protein
VTVPLPVFEAPDVNRTQSALSEAVQAQPAPVVTEMLPLPPLSVKVFDVGEMVNVQAAGGGAGAGGGGCGAAPV